MIETHRLFSLNVITMSHYNSHVEVLILPVTVLGNGALEGYEVTEAEGDMDHHRKEISDFKKDLELLTPISPRKGTVRRHYLLTS